MCGIFGYAGSQNPTKSILSGLKKIEYRGYDSSGIATVGPNHTMQRTRVVGGVGNLEKAVIADGTKSDHKIGIGHTRWATHGKPTEANAHPHVTTHFAVVHNGIIENYEDIKHVLKAEGFSAFTSQTDTEVLAWLIERNYQRTKSVKRAITNSLKAVRGSFGLAIICTETPEVLYVARRGSPIIIGEGVSANYATSDITALPQSTKKALFLEDDQVALLTKNSIDVYNLDNEVQDLPKEDIHKMNVEVTMSGHDHFLIKEILEQPSSLSETLRGRLDEKNQRVVLGGMNVSAQQANKLTSILGVGCGTAYYSSLLSSYLLEDFLDVPMRSEMASELLYRKILTKPEQMIALIISQSGETADTIAATNKLQAQGIQSHGIVNAIGSSIARLTDGGTYLYCGPEISVASTKAFSSQVVAQVMVGLKLHELRGGSAKQRAASIKALANLPKDIESTLAACSKSAEDFANKYSSFEHAMYLGRNSLYPVALEGALKLKEISYTQTEAHPAGEMKHGPLALVDEKMLVMYLIRDDELFEKSLSNLKEIEARNGTLLVITDSDKLAAKRTDTILIPKLPHITSPLAFNIPLQLFAYFVAKARGLNIDKPRNLAKSVTVE